MNEDKFKNDHDILITLVERVNQVRDAIQELKDGTQDKLKDHEDRINVLEDKVERNETYNKLMVAIGLIVLGMMIWHLTGFSI